MTRRIGDRQKLVPLNMNQLTAGLAKSIKSVDERFERFWKYTPIPKFMNPNPDEGFYACKKPIKSLCGGNRSTKTYAATFETIMVYTGIIPPSMQGLYAHETALMRISSGPKKRPRGCRIIVQSLKHFADTILPILTSEGLGMLPEAWSNWDSSLSTFFGPDGSFLEIMPIDPRERDQTKTANTLRGADIDHTQIDEITAYAAYSESIARAAAKLDGPKTVTMAYCPQEGWLCWTAETLFMSTYERRGNITFRKPPERCFTDVFCIQVSMKDNPSITPESYESQRRRYKPWEVAFRVDGEYSDRTSNPYFSVENFLAWEEQERYEIGKPYMVEEVIADADNGEFQGRLLELDEGMVCAGADYDEKRFPVWRVFSKPQDGHKYVLSGDIGEGNPESDPSSFTVWDCTNQAYPVEAAKLYIKLMRPGAIAVQACCMANIYGDCLLVPEANNTGGGMFLDRARNYVNMYMRQRSTDTEEEKDTDKMGWFTSRHNKGPILDNAYRMLLHMSIAKVPQKDSHGNQVTRNFCPFKSRIVLHEFISYEERVEKDKDGNTSIVWGSKKGAHDDTVMDACIAFRIINHEYDKISACKLSLNSDNNAFVNRHRTELQSKGNQNVRAFSNMKKQVSMKQRCRQMGSRHG